MDEHRSVTNPRRRQTGLLLSLLGAAVAASGVACGFVATPADPSVTALLESAPTLPIGSYDYFGKLKNADEAAQLVRQAGLDPAVDSHYARIGLVHITPELIQKGRDLFFREFLGDPLAIGGILNFGAVFVKDQTQILQDSFDPDRDPDGALAFFRDAMWTSLVRPKTATTNLRVQLSRDLHIGSHVFPAGSFIDTGADIEEGAFIPIGFEGGSISCSLCHAAVDPASGKMVAGMPNTDLNIKLFIALSSNTTAVF